MFQYWMFDQLRCPKCGGAILPELILEQVPEPSDEPIFYLCAHVCAYEKRLLSKYGQPPSLNKCKECKKWGIKKAVVKCCKCGTKWWIWDGKLRIWEPLNSNKLKKKNLHEKREVNK